MKSFKSAALMAFTISLISLSLVRTSVEAANRTSDVLWRNVNTGQFVEWLMSNGGVGAVIPLFTEPAEWQVQGIGDFNGQ